MQKEYSQSNTRGYKMPDRKKLSAGQARKVKDTTPNNWSDIKIFLHAEDKRAGASTKQNYGTIEIQGIRNREPVRTTISVQVCGRE